MLTWKQYVVFRESQVDDEQRIKDLAWQQVVKIRSATGVKGSPQELNIINLARQQIAQINQLHADRDTMRQQHVQKMRDMFTQKVAEIRRITGMIDSPQERQLIALSRRAMSQLQQI